MVFSSSGHLPAGCADTEDLGVELLTPHLGTFRGSKGHWHTLAPFTTARL